MGLFFQNKKEYTSQSISKAAWLKFKKNRQGMFLLLFVVFIALCAILGYLITPDSTPYANEQLLEIRLQKPGSSTRLLLIRKNQAIKKNNAFHKMLFGQTNPYRMLPLSSYRFHKDSIIIERLHETPPYNISAYSLAEIVYPVKSQTHILSDGRYLHFTDIYNQSHSISIQALQTQIEKEHIITKKHLLGTDRYGRDVLSQLIIGARVSLSVGFISVSIALLIGVFLGAVAGYFRGWIDDIIMWFINVVWSIPTLLLVIAISFALGAGFWQIFVAIGLTMWVDIARVVRGQVISLREKEFVEASKAMGFNHLTIIFKHIIPNISGTIIVIAASNFASAILTEAGLSFLGIGVQPPMPSWGSMIKENYGYIILDYAYLAIIPGIAIMLLVLAFMLLGNTIRDVMDVKEN
ncbi:MAG: ABC transporter permease [Bacteroidales bacterium]|jgi:peptide/nickel transport system permease protein|nr:ABC transporter permease [Bacteroidales bacterium]MDD3331451.1 ABC transporter permease [Bacteroidales bacterium]MDD3691780.1 ABC transporter permease [Bacteroidales bacterium]MDD4045111.1 ABC transporter permease [Bacteroidales bacterium]MDD4582125.1 ABC transporter permease [Bacteroidales bacterium]